MYDHDAFFHVLHEGHTLMYPTVNQCFLKVPRQVLRMHKPASGEFIHYFSCSLNANVSMQICNNWH